VAKDDREWADGDLVLSDRAAEACAVAVWIERSGGSCTDVEVAGTPECGLGLAAAKAVRRGDAVVRVPLSLGISAESALRSAIGPYLVEFEPALGDYAFIAVSLLHERRLGNQSDLGPWLSASLLLPPAGFPDLPLLWDREGAGIAELDAATTAGAYDRRADLIEDYWWLKENVFDSQPVFFPEVVFSYDAYAAAVALAISRSVKVVMGDDEVPVLLPILDLPNHNPANPNVILQTRGEKRGLFESGEPASALLIATSDVGAGEQLRLRYGGSPGDLLLDHGFVNEPVEAVATLAFALDDDDRFLSEKEVVLEEAGIGMVNSFQVAEGEEAPTELISFLRLKHLGAGDAFLLEPVFLDVVWAEYLALPVSRENEEAALTEAAAQCAKKLGQFGGSLQSDLQVLAEAPRSSREYALSAVRYAERRALQDAARQFDARLMMLDKYEYYQQRRLKSLGLDPIETEEEVEKLRAGGRSYGADEYDW